MHKSISLTVIILLAAFSNIFAQTNTSIGTLWNVASNWSLNQVPQPGHDVVINTNMVMNMPAGSFTINSLTVNSGFTLTIGNSTTIQTIVVTNDVTTLGTGTINVGAFNAIHSLTIGGSLINSGTLNFWNSAAQNCNVTMNGTSITGNGVYSFNNLVIGSTVTNNSTSTINFRGNLTLNNSLTCTAGTLSFIGGAQSILGTATSTFNNLTLTGTAASTKTLGGNASTLNISGNLLVTGTTTSFTIGNTASQSKSIAVAGNVQVDVGSAINIGAFDAIHSLAIGGILTNAGTLTLGTSAVRACNVTLNGTSITGNGAYTFNSIIIGGAVTNNSTSTINVRGDMTVNNTFTNTAGTISFMGAVAQNLNGTTNPTFNNLDIRNTGTAVTVGGTLASITVNGTLTMNGAGSPTLNLGSALSTFSVGGNFTMANGGTTFDFGSTVAKTVTITGNLVTPQTITMTGAGLAHQLILTGAANAAPTLFNTTAGSGSIVEYNNTTSQTVFASANYRFVKLSGSGTKIFSGATTINNDLDIPVAGILVSNANTLTIAGNLDINGTGTTTWGGAANTTNISTNLIVTNNTTFTIGSQAANKTLNITGNVQVDVGSTLNVGDFAATHPMTISGNLQVDGSFNMVQTFPTNVCNVTFSGAANNTVTGSGTINFNQITLTKGAIANILDVQSPITMSSPTAAGNFLTITSGTFKLSSASTLTPYFGATTICAGIGALWINHPAASVSSVGTAITSNPGAPTVTGTLRLTSGTFAYGSGDDVMALSAATSNLWIEGGTLSMYGGIAFSSTSQFNMTSGNVNMYPQGFNNLNTTVLSFGSTNATNAVSFTGGTITIVDPPANAQNSLAITGTAGVANNFSGSTINFGDGISNNNGVAGVGFRIAGGSVYGLGNVYLNNGSSTGSNRFIQLVTSNLIVNGELNIGSNTNDNLFINGRLLTLNGTIAVGTGTLVGSATSSLAIGGNNTPIMNLPPIVGGNLLSLTINKTGSNNTVNLGNSITLAAGGILTLTSGVLELGNNNLTLTNNGAAAIAGGPFSATNMISTNGTGYLVKNAVSLQALNPIGAGGYYSPMTLTSIAANTGTYSIRAVPTPLNPAYINVYWDFRTSVANKTITATFQYDAAQLNGASQSITYLPDPYLTAQTPPVTGTSSFGANSFTITGNTTATNGGYWTMGGSRTYYSYQTGDWNVATTWTSDPSGTLQIGSSIPGFDDNVVILAGRTVSLTGNIATQALKVAINSSGFLDMSTFSFTNGLATLSGQGTLRLASVNFPTAASNTLVNTGGGTVEYYNAASFTLPATQTTYNNLNINAIGQTATQVNNLTLNGNLWVRSGTFQINDNTSARRQLLISGNVTVNSGASISVGNGVTNTVTDPTAVAATAGGPFIGYYDNHSHRVVINGDFVNNGTVNFSNITVPVFDAFPPTVLGPNSGFATVYFRGSTNNVLTCNGLTNFYNLVVDKGTDQTYTLTVNSTDYNNFKLLGANNAAADITGASATNPNIKKALWIRNGTLVLQGSTIIPSLTEGNITAALPATSDYFIPANGALSINGPDVIVLATADDYQEVNTAYGVSGGSGLVNGLLQGGYSSLYVYGKLQVSNGYLSTRESGGIITNGGSGQVIIAGGDVDAKQFLNGTGSTASFQMTGGLLSLRGRFRRTPSSYISIVDLTDNSSATINTARALQGITSGFGTFSINNTANIFNMSGGDIWIYDVCDDTPPAAAPFAFDVKSSSANQSVTGGTLTIIPTTGTVLADESAFLISSAAPLGNVVVNQVSGAIPVQLNTGYPLTVLSDLAIQAGTFNANTQNVTVGGNFSIANGSSYVANGASANTTIFNGSGGQTFTVNTAGALNLNNLTFTKTAGVAVNFAGTQNTINVSGNLTLTLGTLNDNGNSIFVAGNVFNSGLHSGTGKISLIGSASTQTIDGNGVFQNLELNNTNTSAAPVSLINNTTINGTLTFSQDKLFNIGIYNLRFNASATVVNAGPLRYVLAAGNVGDGGITKVYASTASFVFPLGAVSTSRVGSPAYTPATIGFGVAPTTYGSITVRPVGYAHPNATTPGRSLSYFWRVTSSGFTLGGGTVTHGYTYASGDVITGAGISENEYVAARFNTATSSWTKGTASDLDIVGKIIGEPGGGTFLQNASFIDGDYTAGDDNPIDPFGTPKTFYSFATGVWGSAANWTTNPDHVTYSNPGSLIPGAGDIVVIGNNHTISMATPAGYLTTANTDPRSCATLIIKSGATLDNRFNPASNFGIVQSNAGGNGTIRITTAQVSGSTFANPLGDFSDFNVNLGTTELYSTNPAAGSTYWMRNGVTSYGNLLFSPLGGSNIIFPNNDVIIFGNCTATGQNADSWLLPTWNTPYPTAPTATVAKTITINGNLDIRGGSFGWYGNGAIAENVVVRGNVTICTACAFGVFGSATNQTITIGGSLVNNGNATTFGIPAGANFTNLPLIFDGNSSASITNTAGTPVTVLSSVTVNKGTSQATTLTLDIAGTLTTPTNNWLNLQNGTFRYMRTDPLTNFTISTTTNLSIPSTAGLYIDYANANNTNVFIANNGSDASDLLLSGKLTVVRGNVYIGPNTSPGNNNDIEYSGNTAAIEVNGGNLFVNGQIRRATTTTNGALTYTQSGGVVQINGNSSGGGLAVAQTRAKLEVVNAGSQFNMSGGTLTILRGSGTTFGDLFIRPAASTVTGGSIIFSNIIPNSTQNYSIDSNTALFNLTINGAAGFNANVALTTNPLVLNGSLTLSNIRSFLNCNNRNVTIRQDLVNNAAPANYIFGTNLTTFSGTTQNISGTSITNFYDLTVAPSVSLTVNNSFTVNRNLSINSGNLFLNSNLVSVLTNGSFINNGAYTDDNSTGGINMAGTLQQQISGTGSFNRLVINNASGVQLLNDITLDHDLVMSSGIFNIQSNNLILNTTSNIIGGSFSATKMIMTDGVATSLGLTKFFPVIGSTTLFTFPLGVTSKYTPAEFTINANGSIGYIKVAPVNSYQPTVTDPARVLDYYFSIASSGITGFDGSMVLNYLSSDVNGTESDYVASWLQLPGTFWSKAAVGPGTDNVDETLNQIYFSYPAGTSNLNGDYTAGEDTAIPNEVPTYISNSDGNWSDNTIWTPVGASPPCPPGGPNGYFVIIQHNVSTDVNNCFAYNTVIQGTGQLSILSPTFGHNFGTVDGDPSFGTGTVYLENGNLPAGNFTPFMDCFGDGTLEYGGTGTYTMILNGFTTIPNLTVSGTGARVLPNSDLTICNKLIIDGPVLDNSVNNIKLTINGSMERYNTGAFISGTGTSATVSFSGAAAQMLGGATGNFTGVNRLNNLEINNSAGLTIGAGGNIEVSGNLLLTNGVITTSMADVLSILNTSSSAVIPTGGSNTSYINGPLKKQIVNGDSFVYPLGKGAVKGHTFTFTATSTGTSLFTAEFFTPNPVTAVSAPLVVVNQEEYWAVTATSAKTGKIKVAWDALSNLNGLMTQNGITDLQVAEFNSGTSLWNGLPSTTSGVNNNGDAQTTNNVSLSTTPKNYTIGSLTTTKPAATLSPTGPVCGTSGIPVTFITQTSISLNYTISYNYNGVPQTPIVVTSLPFSLPTPSPGTYQLTGFLYDNSTLTGVVDPTIITTYEAPTTSLAGPNQSLCNATSVNLQGNVPTIGTGLWTIVSGVGGWFNTPDATNYNALFGGPPGQTYTLRWTISNGACSSSSTVVISFPFAPVQPSAFISAPTSVCQGSSGNIYSVPAVAGATAYVWAYSGIGATINGSGNSVSVDFSLTATSGNISVSAVNGCGTGAARIVAVSTVTTPIGTFSYAANPYCQNGVNPSPTFSGGGVSGTFSSTAGLVFVSTATGEINLAASTPGTYTVTNTINGGACGIITSNNTITIITNGSWLGAVSSDWFDSNNWICNTIPTSIIDVIIPASAPNMPIIGAAGAISRNITINNGASLTINGTNALDVYGNWINNGTFNRNSSTVSFHGTGIIGGTAETSFNNITIVPSGTITAPVSNVNISGNWINNGLFTPSTGTITFIGTGAISGSSVNTFNNLTISVLGNMTAPASNMNILGNWTNNGIFTASTGTVTFTGSTTSTIEGTSDFYNLSINKTAGNIILNGTGITTVTNQLGLTTGNVVSSSLHQLSLTTPATVFGGSVNSFVSGPMRKTLNAGIPFTAPLGSNSTGLYRPVTISNTNQSDTWELEYVNDNPTNGGYSNNIMNTANILSVSMFEYWLINRTAATIADVTLNYGTGSYIPPDIGNVSSLRVARWDGARWDLPPGGGAHVQSGNNIAGSVTVSNVTAFSPFTFSSIETPSALPIELISFNAKKVMEGIELKWKTASEINNDYFSIERSSGGEKFGELTRLKGVGNSNEPHEYKYVDTRPGFGKIYYRLKQTDFDGKYTYSNVIMIDNSDVIDSQINIFPNPSNGSEFSVEIIGMQDIASAPLVVFDQLGRECFKVEVNLGAQYVVHKLIMKEPLSSGVYFIRIGTNPLMYKRIVITR